MAKRDLRMSFWPEEEGCPSYETLLPPFPHQDRIAEVLPRLLPRGVPLGKTDFLNWVNFTLEYPDEIWESERPSDEKIYHYVNFFNGAGKAPAFVVEVGRLDEFTEVNDYSFIIDASALERIRSSSLVYSMKEEWERDSLIRSLNEEALKKYDEDRLQEAGEMIERALSLSGFSSAYLFNNRGLIYWKMSKSDQAKQDFLEAIRLDGANGDPLFNLGLIYFDECDYAKALHYLEKAVELNPKDSQFLLELGHLYLDLERENDALHLFKKILEQNPNEAQVDFHLGYYFLYKKNRPHKALKYYNSGLKKEPEDQFALADLAVVHWALGHKRKSLDIRRILQEHSGLMPYTVSRLVYLNLQIGDYDSALKYYHEAMSYKEPFELEWLHYNAALVYARSGRPRKALDTLYLAVRVGGEAVIKRALSEKSLRQLKGTSAFKKLIKLPDKRRNR